MAEKTGAMIVLLQGLLMDKTVEHAVVDVHGVGYQADIPLSTYYVLPDVGEHVTLRTTLYVRDDAMRLYGFGTETERSIFEMLIAVSSIGPRLALNMLSSIPAGELQTCIAQAEVARLQTIPGIGRKTAERVVLELQEKVARLAVTPSGLPREAVPLDEQVVGDVMSALLNLGYKRSEAQRAVQAARRKRDGRPVLETLLKDALQQISA
jgi:Holliday junction DNA helicase RuvA